MRKRLTVVVALVVGSLLVGGIAVAAPATEANVDPATEAEIGGRGHLWAVGTGSAVLRGKGTVAMAIDGDVVITDHAGDLRVFIASGPAGTDEEALAPDSVVELDDFRGRLRIVGSGFTLEALGTMVFHAHGKGHASLEGRGVYRARAGCGTWGDGVAASFGGE